MTVFEYIWSRRERILTSSLNAFVEESYIFKSPHRHRPHPRSPILPCPPPPSSPRKRGFGNWSVFTQRTKKQKLSLYPKELVTYKAQIMQTRKRQTAQENGANIVLGLSLKSVKFAISSILSELRITEY